LTPISTSVLALGADFVDASPGEAAVLWPVLAACMASLECLSPWLVAKALRAGGDVAESDNAQAVLPKATTP
jgi:hypothetical protein